MADSDKPCCTSDWEITSGPLKQWGIMIKIVTNHMGMVAVTDGADNVLHGPTADLGSIGEFINTYMTED